MKHMNARKKLMPMNIQFFAESSEGGEDSKGAGGDDPDGDEPDEGGEEDLEEKKYTQKDMDDAVEKRLAREKRKWQRQESQKPKPKTDNKPKESDNDANDTEASEKIRRAEEKAVALELKWACLEHDVKRDCVDDVLALAKVHIAKDTDMDIEDAIDKVLEKYPHFKDGNTSEDDEDETDKKGWGQRHGKPPKKEKTVDDVLKEQLFGK